MYPKFYANIVDSMLLRSHDLSNFPFFKESLSVAGDFTISSVIPISERRLYTALSGGDLKAVLDLLSDSNKIASFYGAVILAKGLPRSLQDKFAIAESKLALFHYSKLPESTKKVVLSKFNLPSSSGWVPVATYIQSAPPFGIWKLANRKLDNGNVYVHSNEIVDLLEESIRNEIYTRIKSAKYSDEFKPVVDRILSRINQQRMELGAVDESLFPKCIQNIIDRLNKGEDVEHVARWVLAVFLISIGMDVDSIVDIFRDAPDFDEDVTRYQLNHIIEKGYKPITFAKMKSYGLCDENHTENTPYGYYVKRKRMKR